LTGIQKCLLGRCHLQKANHVVNFKTGGLKKRKTKIQLIHSLVIDGNPFKIFI
jgi:hypothetical protein